MPQDISKYKTKVNASGYACGGVLFQIQENHWKTIAFCSNLMNDAECNYGIEDCEMLAIMTALKDWRTYLLNTREIFEIWTDHTNLQYFKEP